MRRPLLMHKKIAPKIPSVVFLGEILWANGLLPNRFPKRSPPLSAYHERHKEIAISLGL